MFIYLIRMENREQQAGRIEYLVKKLRYITLAVQILPFMYSFFYILCLVLYMFCPENILHVLDTLFYVSPVIVCAFMIESHILELCKWHRAACILPVIPQIIVFIDYHIVTLIEIERYFAIATPVVLSLLLLIAAYNVFFR